MGNIGVAILLMMMWPFAALGTLFVAIFGLFRFTRRIAFPAMFFFIGCGFGNAIAHESWPKFLGPLLKAPIHSLVYAILFAMVAFLLLSFRSAVVFRALWTMSLVVIWIPTIFIAVWWGSMAAFRNLQPGLVGGLSILSAVLGTVVLSGWLGIHALHNATDFYRA